MSAENVNVVVVTGNLTRDPELRALGSGTSLCKLRLAVNGRRKDNQGQWHDKPNYFDVTLWGARGEAAAEHLAKGSPVAVEGRLDWREWEVEGAGKRQTVEIVAEGVQFLGSSKASKGASDSEEEPELAAEPESSEAGAEEQPDPEEEALAQAGADEESELRAMTREQLDARARNLGIETPERLQNKAAVISEVAAAEVMFDELDEGVLEEDRPF